MKKQAKKKQQERRKLAKDFLNAAQKYLPLAGFTGDEHYAIFIAKSPVELVKEGSALDHCVGRNGYDKKMAKEETLIFFVRKLEELDKPFVTLEYSLKTKQILRAVLRLWVLRVRSEVNILPPSSGYAGKRFIVPVMRFAQTKISV